MEVTDLPRTRIALACGDEADSAFLRIVEASARLQRRTALPVSVLSGADVPDDAVILMWYGVYVERAWPLDVRRRIILVDLDRSRELERIEAEETAAGIGGMRYWEWLATPWGNNVAGLFARRDVLATMPGPFELAEAPYFASDHYACVYDAPYPDFAAMIVAYATAVLAMPAR